MSLYRSDGRFQLWSYTVSHAQLHIRSPRDEDRPSQVDILFVSVELIELPTAFSNVTIAVMPGPRDFKTYRLSFQGGEGIVVAGNFVVKEWDGHHNDPHPWAGR